LDRDECGLKGHAEGIGRESKVRKAAGWDLSGSGKDEERALKVPEDQKTRVTGNNSGVFRCLRE
jgi:hypothetical protein